MYFLAGREKHCKYKLQEFNYCFDGFCAGNVNCYCDCVIVITAAFISS